VNLRNGNEPTTLHEAEIDASISPQPLFAVQIG
jgi:hypothetical protein